MLRTSQLQATVESLEDLAAFGQSLQDYAYQQMASIVSTEIRVFLRIVNAPAQLLKQDMSMDMHNGLCYDAIYKAPYLRI